MSALARELGFEIVPGESPGCLRLKLRLTQDGGGADVRPGGVST